jgi:hypothetical protein
VSCRPGSGRYRYRSLVHDQAQGDRRDDATLKRPVEVDEALGEDGIDLLVGQDAVAQADLGAGDGRDVDARELDLGPQPESAPVSQR